MSEYPPTATELFTRCFPTQRGWFVDCWRLRRNGGAGDPANIDALRQKIASGRIGPQASAAEAHLVALELLAEHPEAAEPDSASLRQKADATGLSPALLRDLCWELARTPDSGDGTVRPFPHWTDPSRFMNEGPLSPALATETIPALVTFDGEGVACHLTLELVPGGDSPHFVPVPALSLVPLTGGFLEAIEAVRTWLADSGCWPDGHAIRWRLVPQDRSRGWEGSIGFEGNSAGGAFALGSLRLLSRSHPDFPDPALAAALAALDLPRLAVLATLTPAGDLDAVGEDFKKLIAARDHSLPRIDTVISSEAQAAAIRRTYEPLQRGDHLNGLHFFFAARLVDTIHTVRASQESPVDAYQRRMIEETRVIPLIGLGRSLKTELPMAEAYVPLQTRNPGGLERQKIGIASNPAIQTRAEDLPLTALFPEAQRNHRGQAVGVAILGDPGSGKTTITRRIFWELASGHARPEDYGLPRGIRPVLLRFRNLGPADLEGDNLLYRFLKKDTHSENLPPSVADPADDLWQGGPLLWLLDGLDEIVSEPAREQMGAVLATAVRDRAARGDRFLLTSRFSGLERVDLPPCFEEFHVQWLAREDIPHFIGKWFRSANAALHPSDPDKARRQADSEIAGLCTILDSAPYRIGKLREVCANPLLLTLLCVVYHQNTRLPDDRAQLYSECVEVLLDHWRRSRGDQKTGTRRDTLAFDPVKARELLATVAWRLHQQGQRASVPFATLAADLGPLLDRANDPAFGSDGAKFLAVMRDECGLLASLGGGTIGFLHLTFQEFLAAEYAARHGRLGDLAALVAANPWWREAALLALWLCREEKQTRTFFQRLLRSDLPLRQPGYLGQCVAEVKILPPDPFIRDLRGRAGWLFGLGGKKKSLARRRALLTALLQLERLPDRLTTAVADLFARERDEALRTRAAQILKRQGRDIPGYENFMIDPHGIALVRIPAGEFILGEGSEAHPVRLTRDFWLGQFPVTNAEYRQYLEDRVAAGETVSVPDGWNSPKFNGDQQPVVGISWNEARAFCEWAGGRLPTEAEWEYACRAGSTGTYCFGDSEAELPDYAWFEKNAEGRTHDVGQKKPNAWGLYDMHGNVWEWCADWLGDYPTGLQIDPEGPDSGSLRVYRGGGWRSTAKLSRSAFRLRGPPGFRYDSLGFRLALSPVRRPEAG